MIVSAREAIVADAKSRAPPRRRRGVSESGERRGSLIVPASTDAAGRKSSPSVHAEQEANCDGRGNDRSIQHSAYHAASSLCLYRPLTNQERDSGSVNASSSIFVCTWIRKVSCFRCPRPAALGSTAQHQMACCSSPVAGGRQRAAKDHVDFHFLNRVRR